ncbi:MAG: alcohol dehydrogenase family protein [candidate division KSB1 bacterium]|nr:alcohol dehydrogenase family protein [candidate division KSB1 bacterium]
MKALTFHGKQEIKHETVGDPAIKFPGDVIIKVHLAGICGSDLREKGLDLGTIMGHELVGEIVELGNEVRKFRRGDVVISPFTTNCGDCFYCRDGLTCRCTAGQLLGWVQNEVGLHGAQAEYVRVPLADSTLLRMPENGREEVALLLGDVLPTGWFCAKMAEITADGVYAVIGCGPVGLMAILSAQEMGAEKIYAIDTVDERLRLAATFGAIPIDFAHDDPVMILQEATEGRGADAVLEVVGSPEAMRLAVNLLRPGGVLAAVGVHNESHFAFSPAEAYDKNLTFKTGRCPARHYMEQLTGVVQKKHDDLLALISHRLPLAEGPRGYEIFDRKLEGCTKVVLRP